MKVFVARGAMEEKAYIVQMPHFFPAIDANPDETPTITTNQKEVHQEEVHARANEFRTTRADLSTRVIATRNQVQQIIGELHVPDISISSGTLNKYTNIIECLRQLYELFDSDQPIVNLREDTIAEVERLCTVMQTICGSIVEIIEIARAKADAGQPRYQAIWDDYTGHMKRYHGLDFESLIDLCQQFAEGLTQVLVW
jgi:hypothetical protein